MVGLGLLLLVLSGALGAAVALSNTDAADVSALGYGFNGLTTGGLFLFGAITGLVFGLGLAMLLAGAARRRTRRRGLKSQVKAVRSERESLAEENARLEAEVYPVEGKHARTRTLRG
jgi:hypothetical protein